MFFVNTLCVLISCQQMCKFQPVFVFKMKKALKFERLFLCLELLTWATLAVDSFRVKVLLTLIYIIIKNKIMSLVLTGWKLFIDNRLSWLRVGIP
jgi:hypothetical protein